MYVLYLVRGEGGGLAISVLMRPGYTTKVIAVAGLSNTSKVVLNVDDTNRIPTVDVEAGGGIR